MSIPKTLNANNRKNIDMDILIGKQGNQPFALTENSISRKHAILHVDEVTGKMTLADNGSLNGTYLQLNDGSFKRISGATQVGPETIVRLGAVQTIRIKDVIGNGGDNAVDISKLRNIYEAYQKNKLSLEAQTSSIMMMRMASIGIGGVVATVVMTCIPSDFTGDPNVGMLIKGGTSLVALLLSWIIVNIKNKNLINRKDQNERFFKKYYCCPKCGYHFGTRLYDNLLAEGKCPNNNCKCKFKGE